MMRSKAAAAATLIALSLNTADASTLSRCAMDRWDPLIRSVAAQVHLRPIWLKAVMQVESGGCVCLRGALTTSRAGAMGLMQLMPATWAEYRETLHLGTNPHDPADNIRAGAAYLKDLFDRYGFRRGLIAYNAGPGRLEDSIRGRRVLPREARQYAERVLLIVAASSASAATLPTRNIQSRDKLFAIRRASAERQHAEP